MSEEKIHQDLVKAKLVVQIDSLKTYDRNPRRGDVETIARSLKVNGQYRPVVVNRGTGMILAGNHTYLAAQSLGWRKIAATYVDVDEDTAKRIVLADNRTAELGGYDSTQLMELLQEVMEQGLAELAATGYTETELDDLIAELQEKGQPLTDEGRRATSQQDRAANYIDSSSRQIVLAYPHDDYVAVVGMLATLGDRLGLPSNAAVVRHLAEQEISNE